MNEETTTELQRTIKHMLTLPDTWDYEPNDPWEQGYTKGWRAALDSLASRMGVEVDA
jgi:hypothetical protein